MKISKLKAAMNKSMNRAILQTRETRERKIESNLPEKKVKMTMIKEGILPEAPETVGKLSNINTDVDTSLDKFKAMMNPFSGSEADYARVSGNLRNMFEKAFEHIAALRIYILKFEKAENLLSLISEDSQDSLDAQIEFARKEIEDTYKKIEELTNVIKELFIGIGVDSNRADKLIFMAEYSSNSNDETGPRFINMGCLSDLDMMRRFGYSLPVDLFESNIFCWILTVGEKGTMIYGTKDQAKEAAEILNKEFDELPNGVIPDLDHLMFVPTLGSRITLKASAFLEYFEAKKQQEKN